MVSIKKLKKDLHGKVITEHGWLKGGLLIKLWRFQNWIDDLWITGFIMDVHWWITDGVAYWDDSVECDRKLCRYCGKKPFNS